MPASEAQIRANQANARLGGPKTEAGKARSRANSYKHGLTGAGIVMPAEDAAEVERLSLAFRDELKAEGEVGHSLAHRMAVMSVRMDRCVNQERAHLAEHIGEALAEFDEEWPAVEGVADPERERMRTLVAHQAMFDPSKKATLARKYEASAERCFFRSLKELRQLAKDSAKAPSLQMASEVAAQAQASLKQLGSFLPASSKRSATVPTPPPAPSKPVSTPSRVPSVAWDPFATDHFDVPIAIGKRR